MDAKRSPSDAWGLGRVFPGYHRIRPRVAKRWSRRCLAVTIAFLVLLIPSVVAVAQQFEFAIPIPESLGAPGQVLYAGGERKLYCYLPRLGQLAVIDPESRELVGFVPVGIGLDLLVYNRQWQRLYCTGDSGLTFVRTTDDEVVFARRDWGRTKLTIDPTQRRVFVYSTGNTLRSVDAAAGDVLDSLPGIAYAGEACFDPLHLRLWGRASGLIDCTDSLTYVGSISAMARPTFYPWDGHVYGVDYSGIYRFDPATRQGGLWWAPESTEDFVGLALNAPGRRFYFFHQWRYGSMCFFLKTIEPATHLVVMGPLLYTPAHLDFVPAGRRVWTTEPNVGHGRTWAASETLGSCVVCDSIRAYRTTPAYDAATQMVFVSDSASSAVAAFRFDLRDSSDVGCALLGGVPARIDTGTACVFRAICVNMGIFDRTVTLRLRLRIGEPAEGRQKQDFTDTTSATLDAYGWGVAVFDTWHPTAGGPYVAEVTVDWLGDVNPANDTARCTFGVWPYLDVAPLAITPVGTLDSGTAVGPKAWIGNSGGIDVTFPVRMTIGSNYADTQNVTLPAYDTLVVSFDTCELSEVGVLAVRCSTMLEGDIVQQNDLVVRAVRVVRPSGLSASDSLPEVYSIGEWAPNPLGSVTRVRCGLPRASFLNATVYSADGRQVRLIADGARPAGYHSVVWDGRDDAGRLCGPGVFLCHVRAGSLLSVAKLTIVR